MGTLNLDKAQLIIEFAVNWREENGLNPLTVAVLDSAGVLIALAREDGASNLRPKSLRESAWCDQHGNWIACIVQPRPRTTILHPIHEQLGEWLSCSRTWWCFDQVRWPTFGGCWDYWRHI